MYPPKSRFVIPNPLQTKQFRK